MRNWMVRGLAFAAAMVIVRLFQGALINAWQTQSALISIVLLVLFIIGVSIWGVLDGRADARANPDPDRREDLAMTWLLGGLLAGVLSGAVAWIIALFYKGIYTGGLINEITTFAAFTALLVFLFGIVGVAIGRWRVDRSAPPAEKHEGAGRSEERADTDVFTAVRGDDSPTGEIPKGAAQTEERTSSVATAEREAPTETIPTTDSDAKTEVIHTTDSDAKTEVIHTDTGKTEPTKKPDKKD
ncbi:B-4DMT family transporter [Mycobacterium szulgai]|nr:B-4DMT family transporter [Mycobacterium szulgai]MCV7074433.1 B-4DMT family transporter [Mycobacterium szulgai]